MLAEGFTRKARGFVRLRDQLLSRRLGFEDTQDLVGELQRKGEPVFEAVAMDGTGVFDTLKAVAKQVLTELRKG